MICANADEGTHEEKMKKYPADNQRCAVEEAMASDTLDEQINFMSDCSRSVIGELRFFPWMIVSSSRSAIRREGSYKSKPHRGLKILMLR